MTITTLESVTIEHLDFDFEPACETPFCTFGHPRATHILISPCCEVLSCTGCAEDAEECVTLAMVMGARLRCRRCDAVNSADSCRVEPLA